MKKNKAAIYFAVLMVYVLVILCVVVLVRASTGTESIQTEWFWGYRGDIPKKILFDNLYNILLFIPLGCLVGIIAPKYKLIVAVLVGLFLSETIECSQLIWQRGSFDVDDLFNNTVGALLGGLIVMLVIWVRKMKKERLSETHLAE